MFLYILIALALITLLLLNSPLLNSNKKEKKKRDDVNEEIIFTEMPKNKPIDPEKTEISWSMPNNVSWVTKTFILSISLLFIIPMFLNFKYNIPFGTDKDFDYYVRLIRSTVVAFKPLNDWTSQQFFFIICYVGVLLFLINIRMYYRITNHGIYYSVLGGMKNVSYYTWEEVSCYELDKKDGTLLIWFAPPSFKHDWEISVPRNKIQKYEDVLFKYSIPYSSKKNTTRSKNREMLINFK